jgi:hypothetical protein
MGANPWHYFTPYRADLSEALHHLREQEFRAGRYGSEYCFSQTISALKQSIGVDLPSIPEELMRVANQAKPSADELIEEYGSLQAAIEAVLEECASDGTQSILDMEVISNEPEISSVCPLSEPELQEIFQTSKPTRLMIEAILLNEFEIEDWEPWEIFWESIGRGEGRYIVAYEGESPTEIFFAGYSFD